MEIGSTYIIQIARKINTQLKNLIFFYKRWRFRPILILNYHQITKKFDPDTDIESIWTSVENFERTIEYLHDHQYIFISLEEAINILNNNIPRKKHYAVITFDDGYASILNILPYLSENDIPATFFINTAYLDEKIRNWIDISNYVQNTDADLIDEEFKIAVDNINSTQNSDEFVKYKEIVENYASQIRNWPKRYLTTKELFSITSSLFTFGLHGHEHYKYDIMSEGVLRQSLEINIEVLKNHPNYVPFFAFPFGRWQNQNLELIKSFNLKPIFASNGLNYTFGIGYNRISLSNEILDLRFLVEKSKEYTILNKLYRKFN